MQFKQAPQNRTWNVQFFVCCHNGPQIKPWANWKMNIDSAGSFPGTPRKNLLSASLDWVVNYDNTYGAVLESKTAFREEYFRFGWSLNPHL